MQYTFVFLVLASLPFWFFAWAFLIPMDDRHWQGERCEALAMGIKDGYFDPHKAYDVTLKDIDNLADCNVKPPPDWREFEKLKEK